MRLYVKTSYKTNLHAHARQKSPLQRDFTYMHMQNKTFTRIIGPHPLTLCVSLWITTKIINANEEKTNENTYLINFKLIS